MGLGAWETWLCGWAANLPPARIIIAPVVFSRGSAAERRSGVPPSRLSHRHCRSQLFASSRPPRPKMRRLTRGGRCGFRVPQGVGIWIGLVLMDDISCRCIVVFSRAVPKRLKGEGAPEKPENKYPGWVKAQKASAAGIVTARTAGTIGTASSGSSYAGVSHTDPFRTSVPVPAIPTTTTEER